MEYEDDTFAKRTEFGGGLVATVIVGVLVGLTGFGVALFTGVFH
jgi:hypothetical protein